MPTSSDDWIGLLERTGGFAPDLVGFGRSAKGGHLDYTLSGEATFLERFVEHVGIGPLTLVGHDWGAAIALVFALRHPDQVQRLALVNPLPLEASFTWPGLYRMLRRPVLGELMMGSIPRWLAARWLRAGSATPGPSAEARLDALWEQFDQGTQRAVLRLVRATTPQELEALAAQLERLLMPAAVIWGEQDPWLPVKFAEQYRVALPDSTVQPVAGAGHWPWLDRAEALERIAEFVLARA